jgi:hypothetical protein
LPEPVKPPVAGENVCGAEVWFVMSTVPPQPIATVAEENL